MLYKIYFFHTCRCDVIIQPRNCDVFPNNTKLNLLICCNNNHQITIVYYNIRQNVDVGGFGYYNISEICINQENASVSAARGYYFTHKCSVIEIDYSTTKISKSLRAERKYLSSQRSKYVIYVISRETQFAYSLPAGYCRLLATTVAYRIIFTYTMLLKV